MPPTVLSPSGIEQLGKMFDVLTPEFKQRLVVWFFGMTVIGQVRSSLLGCFLKVLSSTLPPTHRSSCMLSQLQIWLWPLAIILAVKSWIFAAILAV